MSAHVLLNLLNEMGKSDKLRGLASISSLFRSEFNKFNNTGAPMLDSISMYRMTLMLLKIAFWRENVKILPSFSHVIMGGITKRYKIFHGQTRRHVVNFCLSLYLYPYFVYPSSFGPGESENQNIMCWLVCLCLTMFETHFD